MSRIAIDGSVDWEGRGSVTYVFFVPSRRDDPDRSCLVKVVLVGHGTGSSTAAAEDCGAYREVPVPRCRVEQVLKRAASRGAPQAGRFELGYQGGPWKVQGDRFEATIADDCR
jgi:hypothetical protein